MKGPTQPSKNQVKSNRFTHSSIPTAPKKPKEANKTSIVYKMQPDSFS